MSSLYETLLSQTNPVEGHILPTANTYKAFRKVLEITQATMIYEIGFNAGHSAKMWLDLLSEQTDFYLVYSLDACKHPYTYQLGRALENSNSNFQFMKKDVMHINDREFLDGFDLVCMDGTHPREHLKFVLSALMHGVVPYILINDCSNKRYVTDLVNGALENPSFKYEMATLPIYYDGSKGENRMLLLKTTSIGVRVI